eukprot:15365499-Ditylum_brightwellii.AAC.1
MDAQGVHHKLFSHYQYHKALCLAWLSPDTHWLTKKKPRLTTGEKRKRMETISRCTSFTGAAVDPVDGVLSCHLDIVNYSHLPVSELISSKSGACCQLHCWFVGRVVKKRQQLLYCENCNVTLFSFCYKPFQLVKNLAAQREDLKKMWTL